jgi:hypothetical protein
LGKPLWAETPSKTKKNKNKKRKHLSNKSDTTDSDSDSDTDNADQMNDDNNFQTTGDFLMASNPRNKLKSLPKTNIDIKVCTNANKEDPHRVNQIHLNHFKF